LGVRQPACWDDRIASADGLPNGSQRQSDGRYDHPLYRVLHDSPNADQTALDFWEFICACLEMHGNAYCEIERGRRARHCPISAGGSGDRLRRRDRTATFNTNGATVATRRTETQGRCCIFAASAGLRLGGLSTLAFGRQAFGWRGDQHGGDATFRNGVRPSGVMLTDKAFVGTSSGRRRELLTREVRRRDERRAPDAARQRAQVAVDQRSTPKTRRCSKAGRSAWRRFAASSGCRRTWSATPRKSTSWGTGLEQQTLGFQKFTLRRRLKRIEQALEKQLLTPKDRAEGITIEFNLEGLLRAIEKPLRVLQRRPAKRLVHDQRSPRA
jgi:hypothetical protein